jgi:hypothetical protein
MRAKNTAIIRPTIMLMIVKSTTKAKKTATTRSTIMLTTILISRLQREKRKLSSGKSFQDKCLLLKRNG